MKPDQDINVVADKKYIDGLKKHRDKVVETANKLAYLMLEEKTGECARFSYALQKGRKGAYDKETSKVSVPSEEIDKLHQFMESVFTNVTAMAGFLIGELELELTETGVKVIPTHPEEFETWCDPPQAEA